RERTGAERRARTVTLGETLAGTGDPAAELPDTGERQRHREQQQRDAGDEARLLQLEPPAELFPTSAQRKQYAGQQEKRRDHAERVPAAVPAQFGAIVGRGQRA